MNLPGRLNKTTLGDLLGSLCRAGISGVLELVEAEGVRAGRVHRIYLDRGRVDDVDTTLPRDADRERLGARLDALFRISEALIRFRTRMPRRGAGARPLDPSEFLPNRPRARERGGPATVSRRERTIRALRVLGLGPGARPEDVREAFRRMARESHPDRHPGASPEERRRLLSRFSELSAAYHTVIA
jgi:DnaJ-domain-containing protein 1